MNILIALFLIFFESIPEALYDRGKKTLSGVLEFIYLIVVTFAVFAVFNGVILINADTCLWRVLVGYALLRFAIFDVAYNLARGNSLLFIGSSKLFDKAQSWLILRFCINLTLIMFVKFIALLWGVAWLMGWENGIKI